MALAAFCSKVGVLLLLTYCCNSILSFLSSFAIISLRKGELAVLLYICFCFCVAVSALCLFLTVPQVCLQCLIVAFPGTIRLYFDSRKFYNHRAQMHPQQCMDRDFLRPDFGQNNSPFLMQKLPKMV